MFDIHLCADELESTADWRCRKADENPEDERNTIAANLLECLANEVRSLVGSDLHAELSRTEEGFSGDLSRVIEEENEYRRQIGFREFPRTGRNFLSALLHVHKSEQLNSETSGQGFADNENNKA
jgi:hypothetical protein